MAHDNHLDNCGAAVVSRGRQGEWGGGRVQAIQWSARVIDGRKGVGLQINTLLCYTLVSVLVLVSTEANISGCWILGALFGIVLTLFTNAQNI